MSLRLDAPMLGLALAAVVGVAFAAETPDRPQDAPPMVEPVFTAPISPLLPGDPSPARKPANPVGGDKAAIERGMQDFTRFNCVGCHAPNGGGGMGPSLSDAKWIYGSDPSDVFLTIYQGRPKGMPAWGRALPIPTIWDLVAYVKSLAKEPKGFGRTFSRDPSLAPPEQTPAEFVTTSDPWSSTQPFTDGQKPRGR